ncbi:MAG: bi-domain-containing oxidoreductase [Candidatus Pacebacteria bacterium]|nr:bi-domain-containing oxidoreductase [Candidatus Paceibacterota bacterium]
MRQVVFKKGKVLVEEVPAPSCGANKVLVENLYSLISSGTELSSLSFAKQPLPLKILKYPTKLAKGLRLAKERGFIGAYKIVNEMLESGITPGYSCCGQVVKVGKDINDIKKGDLVVCAGANIASHAEFIAVPRNLIAKVPIGVEPEEACSATIGAIALQGIRQADLRIGESAVVIGLGLVGQLTTQMLLANGIKTIGIELSKERIKKAKENGLNDAFSPKDKNLLNKIHALTDFQGVDATIITAADSSNNEIINQAMLLTRKRGKVVVVGDIGLKIERLPWYEKEIDLRIATSYGPGRNDEQYEIQGKDYPYAYVRWTENRNLQAYLELLQQKKINFSSLVQGKYALEQADLAYKLLNSSKKPLAVLLTYATALKEKDSKQSIQVCSPLVPEGKIQVGLIGVGSFMQLVHLPNLRKLKEFYQIRGICVTDQVKAKHFAQRYGATMATTDYHELLNQPEIDLIMIATRHNLHASMVIDALKAGKNVFVEKPLCLTEQELDDIIQTLKIQSLEQPISLTVGFNRRFSPFIQRIKEIINERRSPLIINYRVNDSYLAPSHWVNTTEGGGRILGNACHMFDLFCYLTESEPEKIQSFAINPQQSFYLTTDNFVAGIQFRDGSVANLVYTTQGDEKLSKEYLEVYSEGQVFILDDFKHLRTYGLKAGMKTSKQQKGLLEELQSLAVCLHQRRWPMPLEEIINATKISLEVDKQVREKE